MPHILKFPRAVGISCILALLLIPASSGAESNSANDAAPASTAEFLDSVNALPIEYRADLQLNAVERQKPDKRTQYRLLLRDLFAKLPSARRAYPVAYAGTSGDTLERTLAAASSYTKLDALSLELKTLRLAFPVEPRWAAEQLRDLPVTPPRVNCSEALVPNVNSYYTTIGDLLFPGSAKISPPDALWLRDHIRGLQSPLPLPIIALLLARTDFSRDDMEMLLSQFEATMQQMSASDRELGWISSFHSLSNAITKLDEKARRIGLNDDALIASYRQFLTNSLTRKRCADSITDWTKIQSEFKGLVEEAHAAGHVHPIQSVDVVQQPTSGQHAIEHPMPSTKESDQILGKMYQLRMNKPSAAQSSLNAESADDLWRRYSDQLSALLDRMDTSSNDCTECVNFFKEKVLLNAFDLIPDDKEAKREILRKMINGLANDPTQSTEPTLWADHLKMVLNLARPVGSARAKLEKLRSNGAFIPFAPSALHNQIRDEIAHSSNDVLAAYEAADILFGNTFTAPYLK